MKQIDAKISLETAETVEIAARNLKRNDWKKFPDEALGTVIKRKLVRRETHAGNGKTAQKKVREFLANLKIQTEQEVDGRWIAEATELRGVLVYGESREAAVIKYQRLAEVVYLENLGAGKILEVNEEYISIQRF